METSGRGKIVKKSEYIYIYNTAGSFHLYSVASTSIQLHDVASMLSRHCLIVACPLGSNYLTLSVSNFRRHLLSVFFFFFFFFFFLLLLFFFY